VFNSHQVLILSTIYTLILYGYDDYAIIIHLRYYYLGLLRL
jgi:hypothetical protein